MSPLSCSYTWSGIYTTHPPTHLKYRGATFIHRRFFLLKKDGTLYVGDSSRASSSQWANRHQPECQWNIGFMEISEIDCCTSNMNLTAMGFYLMSNLQRLLEVVRCYFIAKGLRILETQDLTCHLKWLKFGTKTFKIWWTTF